MEELMTRAKLQKIALKLIDKYNYLLLLWATRVGKTPAAITIIKHYKGRWNIVVAETAHISQWKGEFNKFGAEELLDNINIFCYQSLHKYLDEDVNWVFDEAHHLLSAKRLGLIDQIKKFGKVAFLTATLNKFDKKKLLKIFYPLAQHVFSLSDAIKNKILPEPKIYTIGITLRNNVEFRNTIEIKKGAISKKSIKKYVYYEDFKREYVNNKSIWLVVICNPVEAYLLYSFIYDYRKEKHLRLRKTWTKTQWLRAGLDRKKFLSKYKTDIAKRLVFFLREKSLLIFSGSIDQAIAICGNNNVISSDKTEIENRKILTDFYNGEMNHLAVVNMLTEGMNFENIDAGVIIQLDGKDRRYIQKSGRTFLSAVPIQYILYVKATKDKEYLDNSLRGIDPKYIIDVDGDTLFK